MRALLCKGEDLTSLTVAEVDDPTPGPGQVLVQVHAASVDFVDTLVIRGQYQIPVPRPFVPGNNVAGVVVELGPGCSRFSVGDRVHGMAFVGAYAERAVLSETQLRLTPDGLSADLACLTGAPYRTAYDAIVSKGRLRSGESLVVLGASGGVGSAAVLVGKALGARVIACASTEEKLAFCRDLGADEAVRYTEPDFKDALKAACTGGADVVLDMVGGQFSEPALRATGYAGRFVVVGFAAGAPARIPLNLVLLKGSCIIGYEIADFERREPVEAAHNRDKLEAMLVSGSLAPPVTGRFSLDDAAQAVRLVAGRDKLGTTILELA
ncbi:NADPH:quinone oxidoreductase family protein [Mycobacterium sp. NBC_00419]|uniref:NADPH:quinone oxidoreductase family protein n=1 Tax=Mycobacterium sp. NBC_00419 TaxID=2975989 RepID=UPI002E23BABC